MELTGLATGVGHRFASGSYDVTPLIVAIALFALGVWVFRLRISVPLGVAVLLGGLLWTTVAGTYGAVAASVLALLALFAASRVARDLSRRHG